MKVLHKISSYTINMVMEGLLVGFLAFTNPMHTHSRKEAILRCKKVGQNYKGGLYLLGLKSLHHPP
jgi:hypothetical protein